MNVYIAIICFLILIVYTLLYFVLYSISGNILVFINESSLIGSFSAALITGLIAIQVMKKQFENQKKISLETETKNFLKVITFVESKGKVYYITGKLIVNNNYDIKKPLIKRAVYNIKIINNEFNSIDHTHIPQEYYEQFISLTSFQNATTKNILDCTNDEFRTKGNKYVLEEYKEKYDDFILLKNDFQKRIK